MTVRNDRIEVSTAYLGSIGDNQLIFSGTAFLYGITVGNSGTTVEISDHLTDGDGNIIMKLVTPSTGYYPINRPISEGIIVDIAGAADVTVHYV